MFSTSNGINTIVISFAIILENEYEQNSSSPQMTVYFWSLYSYSLYHLPNGTFKESYIWMAGYEKENLIILTNMAIILWNKCYLMAALEETKAQASLMAFNAHGVNNNISLNNSDNPCWLGSQEGLGGEEAMGDGDGDGDWGLLFFLRWNVSPRAYLPVCLLWKNASTDT